MRRILALLTLLCAVTWALPSMAFTALAVSSDTGFGYCNNAPSEAEAAECALNYCRQFTAKPDDCAIGYQSAGVGAYAVATGDGRWGLGFDSTQAAAEQRALEYCNSSNCAITANWSETAGQPEMATLPPLEIEDVASTVVLITTHGSVNEITPDPCHLDQVNVSQGMSSAIADLDGVEYEGLTLRVDAFCTPHKLGTEQSLKIDLRVEDLRERVTAYRDMGVPAGHIFIVGHSAGGWAALMLKDQDPELFNAVVAAAPAFAGQLETRDEWWQARHDMYLETMVADGNLDALVFAFDGDSFETPTTLADLSTAEGVDFVAIDSGDLAQAGCTVWTHETFLSDCFEPAWGEKITEFIEARLE